MFAKFLKLVVCMFVLTLTACSNDPRDPDLPRLVGDPIKHITIKGHIVDEAGTEIKGCYLVIRGVAEGGSYAINNVLDWTPWVRQ